MHDRNMHNFQQLQQNHIEKQFVKNSAGIFQTCVVLVMKTQVQMIHTCI